jgi:TonB family protein
MRRELIYTRIFHTSAALSLAFGLCPIHLKAAPQHVQVTQRIAQGLLLTKVNPVYPPLARQARIEGTVVLRAVISKEGSIEQLTLVSGHPILVQAAIDAVKQWKYKPYLLNSEPVELDTEIQVNFTLSSSEPPASANATPDAQVRNLLNDASETHTRSDYKTAANLARHVTTISSRSFAAWNLLGISLLELHELDAAATALETEVRLDAASSFGYNNLGRVYWQQRKYDEAIAQFQKQILLNPQDHYAHANLGLLLRDEKKCGTAVPELEKAIVITPNNASVMVALGECEIDLGETTKGLSEMEQATSESSSAGIWNSAAYKLARRKLELDRAQKWAESAVAIESAQLHNISLDHLSTAQLLRVGAIASYWDTLGWILFLRANTDQAASYIQASWSLRPLPIIGYHLGQIYEAQGKHDDATRAYAMAIVAADSPLILPLSLEESDAVADAGQELNKATPDEKALKKLVEQAHADLVAIRQVSIPNGTKVTGSADFTLTVVAPAKPSQVRQISGDSSFGNFSADIQSAILPMLIPSGSSVEIPRRGTLTCTSNESQCRFFLLSSQDAVDLSRKETSAQPNSLVNDFAKYAGSMTVGSAVQQAAQAAAASRAAGAVGQELDFGQPGRLEILSDTQGVDFGPYLQNVLQRVKENWYKLIPESAVMKKGKLAIEFAITKDGQVTGMKLVGSSGDVALDRPAWGSITNSNPFAALPSEFKGSYLALRFHFYYNPEKSDAAPDAQMSGVAGPSSKPEENGGPGEKPLYHRGEGASDPRLISQVDPEYTEKARKAGFQGLCVLGIVVEPDGKPSNIQVISKLGMGLDEKAIEAVKQWRFQPSMKDGHPVRYGPVEVDVDFHLYHK